MSLYSRLIVRLKLVPNSHIRYNSTVARKTIRKTNLQKDLPPPEERIVLPPVSQWRALFPPTLKTTKKRVSIANPSTADKVANAFVPDGVKGKVIIETFPGPGQLTRALLRLPKERIERLIVLEEDPWFLNYLESLEEVDPRLKVIPASGMNWESYDIAGSQGLLDGVSEIGWDAGVHPQLQHITHLPVNVHGEQLIAQYIRFIPDQHWLFKYGRVPMSFLLNDHVWQRLVSRDLQLRCKLTAVADAMVDCQQQLYDELQPYRDHFFPIRSPTATNRAGLPFLAVSVIPKENPLIEAGDMEIWDYCLRRLFVQRATPIAKAISALGPGSQVLIEKTRGVIDPCTHPRELSMLQWAELVKAFKDWPFAPTVRAYISVGI
ncbi:hypothetical protein E1B28_010117 [Marasmius oreades]|uniref:rRNA adenine N(6)-methyltransferase n=1 Tax=Marasmius oreades TaxID=181124 RepID=A0A9P7RX54_9AGAR|nr:uncharacterized protein E1B28_010117 [Marasmius oreades]KAG7091060.1 hypothetical protein E1B28_010117 [Marasmius oreades]